MSSQSEEKRSFAYLHLKALMMISAAHGSMMALEAADMKFNSQEELDAYPEKRRKKLEDDIVKILDDTWEKAK
jgi:hypothetical protein